MLDNDKALIALSGQKEILHPAGYGQPPWTDLRRDRHRQERELADNGPRLSARLAFPFSWPTSSGRSSGAWPCSGKIHGKTGGQGQELES